MKHNIVLLIPYFGRFPEWARLYFETIKRNPTIRFIFYTDCDTSPYESIPNITFRKTTFEEYIENARWVSGVNLRPANPYKLCDLRPLYPIIHFDDIRDADFYGWTDMDVLYGNIRSFYTDDILSTYDVISTHATRISGHLALFRNLPKYRNLYCRIYDWKNRLEDPYYNGIDESGITNALCITIFDKLNEKMHWNIQSAFTRYLSRRKKLKLYLVEQYTTPFIPVPWIDGTVNSYQPSEWYYRNGIITNSRDCKRNFIYLHLMNFKSSQWRHDGTKAPWEGKEKICYAEPQDTVNGIVINEQGIYPLKHERGK